MADLLNNADFEWEWWRKTHTGQEFGEIMVPVGWTAFWKEGLPVDHDPKNKVGYARPEMKVVESKSPYLDPPRVLSGNQAVQWFTFWKIHDCGIYQQFEVTPGLLYEFAAYGHAWSSNGDDPRQSDLEGELYKNITLRVGIDPEGGTDPFGELVIWSRGFQVYDMFQQIGPVTAEAKADRVTVFIRSAVLWPLKHCDVYVDRCELAEFEKPVECPKPRAGWTHRTTVLVRADAPDEVWLAACRWANNPTRRHSVDKSRDHAFYSPGVQNVRIILWMDHPGAFTLEEVQAWGEQYYPGNNAQLELHINYEAPTEPPPPPPQGGVTNYVPRGTKMGFHCIGSAGQTDLYRQWTVEGCAPPSVKAVQDIAWLWEIKQINPAVKTVARFIDDGKGGPSLEWYDPKQDPLAQAQARMGVLMPLWEKHRSYVDYWEVLNEQDPPGAEGHAKLAAFSQECMRIGNIYGYKLAIFSYSLGVPEPDEWTAIAQTGVFQFAAEHKHAISLHEYGVWPIDLVSLLCRYRALTQGVLVPLGLDIPVYITEWAPDAWSLKGITDDAMMGQVAAYDAEAAKDPLIAGVHVFTVGGFGSWPQFDSRWVKLYGRFTAYYKSVRHRLNGDV